MRANFAWFEWLRADPYYDGRWYLQFFWIGIVCVIDMLLTIWPCLMLQAHLEYIEVYMVAFAVIILILR
jgi:hypothetical protein